MMHLIFTFATLFQLVSSQHLIFPPESDSNTVFPVTLVSCLASEGNFLFSLVSSVTVTFLHQVFCLSKYSTTWGGLKKVLTIFIVCGTMLEHTIMVTYFTVDSYILKIN